ncbi:MAG: serine hydrolase [Flavobacteriaceae bacterium]|nr:serine hydrolase [Flavobacteriaceae bacterium]
MKNTIKLLLFIFLLISTGIVHSQKVYYPNAVWQVKTPEELKMNKTMLDSAVYIAVNNENKMSRDLKIANYSAYKDEPNYEILGPTKQRGGPAGVIIKNGYIVAQWGDVNRVDMTFSVAKSYLSTIAGLAIDKGLIKNMNDYVNQYVWDETYETPHNSKIKWEHLLTQTSDWSGNLFGIDDWADRPPKEGNIDAWKNRILYEPGTHYKYNDVRVNLLAHSLLQVWRQPLPVILKENIMDPIGASTTWRWYGYDNSFVNIDGIMMQSVSGGGHFGGGLFINTLDMARFGLLFQRNGKWENKQLISEKWVKSVSQGSSANKSYGYLWWTNIENNLSGVPSNVYYAVGFGGNYIIIDNEHDLVIVTRWIDTNKIDDLIRATIKSIEKK